VSASESLHSLLVDQLAEGFDGQPLLGAVNHPVAVGADEREVDKARLYLAADAERHAVVAFDVVQATRAVGPMEVETARFAGDRDAPLLGVQRSSSSSIALATGQNWP
jgi:hypothetical protein